MKPAFKWVGGKRWMVPLLRDLIEAAVGGRSVSFTLYERFVGGGALFWHLAERANEHRSSMKRAELADANHRLIWAYTGIRENPLGVYAQLQTWASLHAEDPEGTWARVSRMSFSERDPAPLVAAWMIYVQSCGHNGLYRVNAQGQYNVALGRSADGTPNSVTLEGLAEDLQIRSELLHRYATLTLAPFGREAAPMLPGLGGVEGALPALRPGDVRFDDPPYLGTFSDYASEGFGYGQHEALERRQRSQAQNGVYVITSNSDTPAVRSLYGLGDTGSFWRAMRVWRQGTVSAGLNRSSVAELLIVPRSQGLPSRTTLEDYHGVELLP